MTRWLALALSAPLLLAGCRASQFVVHVDTDAPVPPRPGSAADPTRPAWLFDQLRVELSRAGSPAGDTRDFALDEGLFQDRRVSFGLAPDFGDQDLVLRLRLFRGDHAEKGDPRPNATVEADLVLPPLSSGSGPIDLVVTLHVDDVGQPVYGAATHGTVGHSLVGSWPGAQVIPCAAPAGDGEACIPGGAFWMGDPLLGGIDPSKAADEERLVVVSPFYLRTHELTVAEMRGLTNIYSPVEWPGGSDPDVYDNWCNYTNGPSSADPTDAHAALPLNCITWDDARRFCQKRGGDLPSEAQFEFVASGRGEERGFVWGGDAAECADAVWGWGGLGVQTTGYDQDCRDSQQLRGSLPPGGGRRDRAPVAGTPDVEVLDLAGNLSEFALDKWSRQDEAYWSRVGVFTDPVADVVSPADGRNLQSLRGGNFHDFPINLRAAARQFVDTSGDRIFLEVGVRCARPGR